MEELRTGELNRCSARSRRSRGVDRFLSLLFLLLLGLLSGVQLTAQQPGESDRNILFINALREKQYFDTALEYLDRLEAGEGLSPEVKATLLIERANILRDLARTQVLPGDYEPTQKQALEAYRRFIADFPDHPRFPNAVTEITQLRQQELRSILLKIRRTGRSDSPSLKESFRQTADAIRKESTEAEAKLNDRMAKFPKFIDQDESPELFEARQQTESALVNLKLNGAILQFDEAEIAGGKGQERLTTQALKVFEGLVEQYRSNLVGIYAQLYVGRCQLRLEKPAVAQGIFRQMMLIRSEDPQVQSIIDEAHLGLLQSLAEEGRELESGEEKLKDLILDANTWLKERQQLSRTRIGQSVRWEIAQAFERIGEKHAKEEEIRDEYYDRALAVAQPLSQEAGEFQQQASSLVAQLSQKLGRDVAAAKDFNAAFFECMNRVKELETLADGIDQAEDDDERQEIERDLELKRPAAIIQMQQALTLVRPDTPADNIARVRYWLCYLYFLSGRDYEAIVIGEHIGRRFADNPQFKSLALEASHLAVLAYAHAYQTSPPDSREFEVQGMTHLCEFLDKKWPGDPKTDQALLTLGRVLADQNHPEQAVVWFEKIGEASNFHLEAQLSAAASYWNTYLRALASLPRDPNGKPQELSGPVVEYPQIAHTKLVNGIRQAEKDQVPGRPQSDTLLLARLTLAQIENQQGRYQAARDILLEGADSLIPQLKNFPPERQPRTGPHSLPFIIEANRQWLRSAIGLQNLDDALQALESLGKLDGGSGKAADLYVAVGEQFAAELDQWRGRDPRKFHEVLSSFESFLVQLSARPESKKPRILLWMGESWLNLAGSEGESATGLPYLERATTAFDNVLAFAQEHPEEFTPELLIATKFRREIALRRSKKFEPALAALREILKQRPNAIDLQIEGAKLMQDWGRVGGTQAPEHWTIALQGEPEEVEARLWGWGEISARFRNEIERNPGSEKMQNQFFESRLEIADCRYQSAISPTTTPEVRRQLLVRAAADLQFTSVSYNLTGEWPQKYDLLWREVHTAMGVPTPKLPGHHDTPETTSVATADASQTPTTAPAPTTNGTTSPVKTEESSLKKNAPFILFGVGALLALGITIFLNRPRKRNNRRYQRGATSRNLRG